MVIHTNDIYVLSHHSHVHILADAQSTPQAILDQVNSEISQLSLDIAKLSHCGIPAETILNNCSNTSTAGTHLADEIVAYMKAHPGATTLSPQLTAEVNSFQASFTLYDTQARNFVGP